MSGVEPIIGIVLSVLGLADPLSKGVKALNAVAKSSDEIWGNLSDILGLIDSYHDRYVDCCIELFEPIVRDENDIRDMFGMRRTDHPNWEDENWKRKVVDYLGSRHDGLSRDMQRVQKNFATLKLLIDKASKEAVFLETNNTPSKKLNATEKAKIVAYEKDMGDSITKLKDSYNMLQEGIKGFRRSLKKRDSARLDRPLLRAQQSKVTKNWRWIDVHSVLRLYRALSSQFFLAFVENCRCHSMNLRLDFDVIKQVSILESGDIPYTFTPHTLSDHLRFVVSTGDSLQENNNQNPANNRRPKIQPIQELEAKTNIWAILDTECASADTIIELLCSGSKPSSSDSAIPPPLKSEPLSMQPRPLPEREPGRREKMKQKVADWNREDAPQLPPPPSPAPSPTQGQFLENSQSQTNGHGNLAVGTSCRKIASLCRFFESLPSLHLCSGALGYISYGDGFQYHIYGSPVYTERHRTEHGTTLRDFLAMKEKLRPIAKIKLAYQLASSLLLLHSDPWIRNNWRSKDILLLLNQQYDKDDRSVTVSKWLPYALKEFDPQIGDLGLRPPFHSPSVYNLSILLLEIGLEKPMETGGTTIKQEMREVQRALTTGKLKVAANPTYHEVVDTCFKWHKRSSERDLTKEVAQRNFFEEVVDRLRLCLDRLESPIDTERCI